MEIPLGSSSPLHRPRRRIQRKTKSPLPIESSLPEDIIMEILSWLTTKDVLRSRCVCTRWMDLTSTKEFSDLHRRRSSPMILKDCSKGTDLLDRCWEPSQTRSKIHKVYKPYQKGIDFSHNGLVVVISSAALIIYNPIYREVVNITVPPIPSWSVYGVFFHPVQNEYWTLWRMTLSLTPLKVQYKIYNLESNPQWRYISNPCNQNARIRGIPPVLFDEYLYWMVVALEPNTQMVPINCYLVSCDIMEYDIRNEEFRVIPCPVPVKVLARIDDDVTVLAYMNYDLNLVDIDGVVSLVQVIPSSELVEINIWTLKSQGDQLWTCSQYIVTSAVYRGVIVPKVVAFWNGELVLESHGRLYVCNLKLGTFKKFGKKYYHDFMFFPHLTSLVSLKNFKSQIFMLEEDENNQRDGIQALMQLSNQSFC